MESIAKALTQFLQEMGLQVCDYHSAKTKRDQKNILEKFKKNQLQLLVAVDSLTVGFDEQIDFVVIAKSVDPANKRQIIGRCLRLRQVPVYDDNGSELLATVYVFGESSFDQSSDEEEQGGT